MTPPPLSGAIFDPRGMVGRIYREDNYTLFHTKYESSGPCGFREDVLCFSHDDPHDPRAWPVWTPGARLAGFIKRTTIHCYTQNMKAPCLRRRFFFYVFPTVSLWDLMTPGWGHFYPWGMVSRIYRGPLHIATYKV